MAIARIPDAQGAGRGGAVRDEVTLKRFVWIDHRHVELRPESHNAAHHVMKLDLAKHILQIEGVAVGALIGELRDVQGRSRDRGRRKPGA